MWYGELHKGFYEMERNKKLWFIDVLLQKPKEEVKLYCNRIECKKQKNT